MSVEQAYENVLFNESSNYLWLAVRLRLPGHQAPPTEAQAYVT